MADNDLDTGTSYLEKKVTIDFCDSSTLHDRVLIVEGKKFYVNSNHLSMFSEYFFGLFNFDFQEKEQHEIELEDVGADEFETFLNMLYPLDVQVTKANFSGLIYLSNMFLAPVVFQECIKFLEATIDTHNYDLEDQLECMRFSSSKVLKRKVENRCIELYKVEETERFFQIGVDFNLDVLKAHIIRQVGASRNTSMPLDRNIVAIILGNTFAKFEDLSFSTLINSNKEDKIKFMYTLIMMLEYDLPKLEEWLTDNFDRLLYKPFSVKNVGLLIEHLNGISCANKVKLENILLKSAEAMKEKQLKGSIKNGLRNFLPGFAFLLYQNEPKNLLSKSYILLRNFSVAMQLPVIKAAFDNKLMGMFSKTQNFVNVELVLQKNFNKTKAAMQTRLKQISQKSMKKQIELIKLMKSSQEVDKFVRENLPGKLKRVQF